MSRCRCGRRASPDPSHPCGACGELPDPVPLNQTEAELFSEDYAVRAALGERLSHGGLEVPRGFDS